VKDDAEVLKVFSEILNELKIDYEIEVNNRKLINELLELEGIKQKEHVIREIDKLGKLPEEEIKENLKRYDAERILEILKKPVSFFEKYNPYNEIKELLNYCKLFNLNVKFSPNLARGLSYYNGNIFEIKLKGAKESIAGGGSYLINNTQSTGISFGLERLSSLAKIDPDGIKAIVISINQEEKAIEIMQSLRKEEISCFMMDKISKALDYANQENIPYVVFIGEEEVKKNKFKLRDMKTGKEEMLDNKDLIKNLS
jgi:histidyl-tRNA synthetase